MKLRLPSWLMAALLVLQLIRTEEPKPPDHAAKDLGQLYQIPPGVESLLRQACYDCHSNSTDYPFYARVQPFRWWMQDHVRDGREALNFSQFGDYSIEDHPIIFQEIASEVETGLMPLRSYRLMHPEARLTIAQKQLIVAWARQLEGKR